MNHKTGSWLIKDIKPDVKMLNKYKLHFYVREKKGIFQPNGLLSVRKYPQIPLVEDDEGY